MPPKELGCIREGFTATAAHGNILIYSEAANVWKTLFPTGIYWF